VQNPPQSWTGYGIYLGKGLIVTAAHVVASAVRTKPSVRIGNLDLAAHVIKEGSFERVELALLSIDEQKLPIYLQMRRMPLCEKAPWVGEPVIVSVPEGTARSHIMSPQLLLPRLRTRFSTVIGDVATTGNSGSGVFDAGSKCLLGIMSRKIYVSSPDNAGGQKDIAKYLFRHRLSLPSCPPSTGSKALLVGLQCIDDAGVRSTIQVMRTCMHRLIRLAFFLGLVLSDAHAFEATTFAVNIGAGAHGATHGVGNRDSKRAISAANRLFVFGAPGFGEGCAQTLVTA
jgi:hypothetical protein